MCQAIPNVANALLEKTGLTSQQCAALSDGLKDARQPSVSVWTSVKYAISEGTIDLGLPGAQELLRTWILRAEDAPMESLQHDKLEGNIRRMPADVLASLPGTPGWSARWLKYLGSSFVPLPEAFWRAAYRARNRGGEPGLVFRWPGFVHYPELARELNIRKGGHPHSLGERAEVLADHEIARYSRYPRSFLNDWNDWHAIYLGETLEDAVAEALERPGALDVQDLAALILAWPTKRSLPAALLESRGLPEPVRIACIARWKRDAHARWSDWSGLCKLNPADVFEMAARYLESLTPAERMTQMEKAPAPQMRAWSLLWATEPSLQTLTDEAETVRLQQIQMAEEMAKLHKQQTAASRAAQRHKKLEAGRRVRRQIRKLEKKEGISLHLQQPLVPRDKSLLDSDTVWPTVGEVLERLKTVAMARLAPEYGLSDSGLRNMLIDAGVDMTALPRRRPRSR